MFGEIGKLNLEEAQRLVDEVPKTHWNSGSSPLSSPSLLSLRYFWNTPSRSPGQFAGVYVRMCLL